MNLPAAALSTRSVGFAPADSAALILAKYCFTRANSRKTRCSFALTPLIRRYAENHQTDIFADKACIQKSTDSSA